MRETYLITISKTGQGGKGQCIPITPEVKETLKTEHGQLIRVTIDTDPLGGDEK